MSVNPGGSMVLPSKASMNMVSQIQDGKSMIKFAPGTNFEEGLKTRKMSQDAEFHIRMVGKTSNFSRSLNYIPCATDRDESFAERSERRADRRTGCLPSIPSDRGLVTHLCHVAAPVGLAIPTLCSYVAQEKPLLSAAKSSIVANACAGAQETKVKSTTFPLRFPPLATRSPSGLNQREHSNYLGDHHKAHVRQSVTRAGKHSGHYASTDSLNVYLRQSTFHSDWNDQDVYRPYCQVPNLVNSRGRLRAFLRDNERIRMLQLRCLTDDYTTERFEAYKPPNVESVKNDFITI